MRTLAVAGVILLVSGALVATEKYWIARNAQLVVVGRLKGASAVLRDDGWHITGTIAKEEVLFGPTGQKTDIAYHFACSCCPRSRRPSLSMLSKGRGLWFLNKLSDREWESAGPECGDPGYRGIELLEDMRSFLRSREPEKASNRKERK